MIGMAFSSFVVLLCISVIVSSALHYGLKFYMIPGYTSFFGKVMLGWIGAWIGSPMLGHWGPALDGVDIYMFPAVLGCLGALVLAVDMLRSIHAAATGERAPVRRETSEKTTMRAGPLHAH